MQILYYFRLGRCPQTALILGGYRLYIVRFGRSIIVLWLLEKMQLPGDTVAGFPAVHKKSPGLAGAFILLKGVCLVVFCFEFGVNDVVAAFASDFAFGRLFFRGLFSRLRAGGTLGALLLGGLFVHDLAEFL